MGVAHLDTSESPNARISWSIYLLGLVLSCSICGMLAPFGFFALLGGEWFLIAIVFGGATALVVNFVRPRYERATGRWRTFYNFLLKQLPPPD